MYETPNFEINDNQLLNLIKRAQVDIIYINSQGSNMERSIYNKQSTEQFLNLSLG